MAAADVLQACDDPTLKTWLSSDRDGGTMDTLAVLAIFDLLCAFCDGVSRVTGMRMPSGVDPQHPYGQAETEAGPLVASLGTIEEGCGGGWHCLKGGCFPGAAPEVGGSGPVPHHNG